MIGRMVRQWWRKYVLGQLVTDERRRMDEKLRHIEEQTASPEDTWELVRQSRRKDAATDARVDRAQERILNARAETAKRLEMLGGERGSK